MREKMMMLSILIAGCIGVSGAVPAFAQTEPAKESTSLSQAQDTEQSEKKSSYSLYIKDDNLFYTDGKKSERLTSKLIESAPDDPNRAARWANVVNYEITRRKNGNRIFYPNLYGTDEQTGYTTFELMYRDLDKPKAVKIASNVIEYQVNEVGDRVFYYTSDKKYWLYDVNSKVNQIITEQQVSEKYLSPDFNKIVYGTVTETQDTRDYYIWEEGKETKSLAKNVNHYACAFDPKLIVHEPENTLFYFRNDSYVTEDCSALYYTTDCVLYKQLTDGTTPPQKIASNVIVKKIYDSGEMYYTTLKGDMHTLHYFDGTKDTIVKENLRDGDWSWYPFEKTPAIVVNGKDRSEKSDQMDLAVAVGASLSKFYEGFDVYIAPDESEICFERWGSGSEDGVYQIVISDGKAGMPVRVVDGTGSHSFGWTPDGKFVYYKTSDEEGVYDLYIEDTKIDHNAYASVLLDNASMYYVTDYNSDIAVDTATVKMLQDGKVTQIAEDVYDFNITDTGEIFCLQDYNLHTRKGTLYHYSNGTAQKMADGVTAVLHTDGHEDKIYQEIDD